MSSWLYGLVEEKNNGEKELKLMEIYMLDHTAEPGFCGLSWKDIKSMKDVKQIVEDIKDQLTMIVKEKNKELKFKIKNGENKK